MAMAPSLCWTAAPCIAIPLLIVRERESLQWANSNRARSVWSRSDPISLPLSSTENRFLYLLYCTSIVVTTSLESPWGKSWKVKPTISAACCGYLIRSVWSAKEMILFIIIARVWKKVVPVCWGKKKEIDDRKLLLCLLPSRNRVSSSSGVINTNCSEKRQKIQFLHPITTRTIS